uniref:Uncharacterized protein n=1 Tax=Bactrocera latifrons TaxID=174628 RepID=A0A0K8UWH0_BACLA
MLTEKYLKEEEEAQTKNTVDENVKMIYEFYASDDISADTAGRKCTLISKSNNLPISKRFMVMTIREAYEFFKTTFPGTYISRTKFHNNRSKHVELSSKLPHNMCVCQYHGNFSFLLEAMFGIFRMCPSNFGNFLRKVCCDETNEVCMRNECNKCIKDITDAFVPLIYINQLEELTEWKHWRIVDKRIIISYTNGPITDLINELESQLPSLNCILTLKGINKNTFETEKYLLNKMKLFCKSILRKTICSSIKMKFSLHILVTPKLPFLLVLPGCTIAQDHLLLRAINWHTINMMFTAFSS